MSETTPVVVVGASGFGRECLDVLQAMQHAGTDIEVLGVLDDSPSPLNLSRLEKRGTAYLGTVAAWLEAPPVGTQYVLGIGHTNVRERLVALFDAAKISAFTAIHPAAHIGACFATQDGIVICAGASIGTNAQLGRHVHINPNATIGHDAVLHDFVSVNPAATVSGEVEVGTGTLVGAGAVILQMLSVGPRAIVGAGCVVTKAVPAEVVVMGVPGKWDR